MAESTVRDFDELTDRLDEIISTVRSKDTPLERCLDLFDEAIKLGSRAVDMVDSFELTPREQQELSDTMEADADGAPSDSAGSPESGPAGGR